MPSDVVILSILEDAINISNDNIIINLHWPQEFGVFYDVKVAPTTTVTFIMTSTVQITLSYNVSYTMTVVGTQCDQNVSRAVKQVAYGELM